MQRKCPDKFYKIWSVISPLSSYSPQIIRMTISNILGSYIVTLSRVDHWIPWLSPYNLVIFCIRSSICCRAEWIGFEMTFSQSQYPICSLLWCAHTCGHPANALLLFRYSYLLYTWISYYSALAELYPLLHVWHMCCLLFENRCTIFVYIFCLLHLHICILSFN